jgi:hypothetical protein
MRCVMLGAAIAVAATAGLTTALPAQARDWPWCADYNGGRGGGGGSNCGFASWEQCQVNIRGIGGWCYPNPYLRAEMRPPRHGHRRRHYD